MNTLRSNYLISCFSILVGIVFSANVIYAAQPCASVVPKSFRIASKVQNEVPPKLKILTYNVKDFFVTIPGGKEVGGSKHPVKPEAEIQEIRDVISQEAPDFAVLQEVGGLEALQKLLSGNDLETKYKAMLVEGNDERGIEIGFLVKKSLPFSVELTTHRATTWLDPAQNREVPVFSRDLPLLSVSLAARGPPFLMIFGNHAKSKRDRAGDPESVILRSAQYTAMRTILDRYQNQFPNAGILLAGDFNTDVRDGPEIEPIRNGYRSAFDLAETTVPNGQRVTHTFHPGNGPAENHQIDDIRVSANLATRIRSAKIHRYLDDAGHEEPLPRNYKQRERQPSDHFPVVIEIDTPITPGK